MEWHLPSDYIPERRGVDYLAQAWKTEKEAPHNEAGHGFFLLNSQGRPACTATHNRTVEIGAIIGHGLGGGRQRDQASENCLCAGQGHSNGLSMRFRCRKQDFVPFSHGVESRGCLGRSTPYCIEKGCDCQRLPSKFEPG